MPKMYAAERDSNHLIFDCPGCERVHGISVALGRWTWNGSFDAPTVQPSILAEWYEGPERGERRCHSYITDGQIQFLSDCTHSLAGQTVDLPETRL